MVEMERDRETFISPPFTPARDLSSKRVGGLFAVTIARWRIEPY